MAETLRDRDELSCVGVDGSLVRRRILEFRGVAGFIWLRIVLLRGVLNAIMRLRIPYKAKNVLSI